MTRVELATSTKVDVVAEIHMYVSAWGRTAGIMDQGVEGKWKLVPYGLRAQKGRKMKKRLTR